MEDTLGKIKHLAAKAEPLGTTIKFSLEGEIIYIDGRGDVNTVSTEDKEAVCTIKLSRDNFQKLMSGDLNPMMAFMSGKIRVDGDMSVAMKLSKLF